MAAPPDDKEIADRIAGAMSNGWAGRGRVLRDLLATELTLRSTR
jgi:hypothetical protein